MRASSGSETAGLVARDPQQLDRALLGVAQDLHRVRRRRPVRDRHRVDVPELGELADVRGVVPVAQARAGRRRRRSRACSGPSAGRSSGSTPGARPADHAAQQVQVVDLAGGGRRLVGLVEALQHGREQALARCRASSRRRLDVAPPGRRRSRRPARACSARRRARSSSKPSVWASTYASSIQPFSISSRRSRSSAPGSCRCATARWTSASRATGVGRGSTHEQPRRVRAARGGRASASRAPSASRRRCGPRARSRRSGRRRCRSPAARRCRSSPSARRPAVAVQSRVLPSMCGVPIPALPITASV